MSSILILELRCCTISNDHSVHHHPTVIGPAPGRLAPSLAAEVHPTSRRHSRARLPAPAGILSYIHTLCAGVRGPGLCGRQRARGACGGHPVPHGARHAGRTEEALQRCACPAVSHHRSCAAAWEVLSRGSCARVARQTRARGGASCPATSGTPSRPSGAGGRCALPPQSAAPPCVSSVWWAQCFAQGSLPSSAGGVHMHARKPPMRSGSVVVSLCSVSDTCPTCPTLSPA